MSLNSYLAKEELDKQIYILRYYLPCEPIYDRQTTKRRSDELLAYCKDNRVQAVMLYVDLNPYWYYMPDSLEHTEYYTKVIDELAQRLRQEGISYQLNYQNLFGSWDGGADMRHVNGWENYVDQYGNESWGCGCSLGEKFREIAGAKLRLWAQTKPDIIWIDDDIRFHNHRTAMHKVYTGEVKREELDFGCFCDKHIASFNRRYSMAATREQIHQGILDGGDLRRKWLEFSRECANEVAKWIENVVYEVSPDTTVALMSSRPDVHSVEGRHWGKFLKNLSGDKTPIVRAHFGPYCENLPHEFYDSFMLIEQLKENIKAQYDGEFEFCPEIENTRFSVWSKSIAATRYQLMLSAFLGCKGVTLSIYDLEGGTLDEYPEFAHLLEEVRPFCDAMAKENLWNSQSMGISIITSPDRVGAKNFKRGATAMEELVGMRLWDRTFVKCGIPCKYITPDKITQDDFYALDAFSAELLTDDEIIKVLSAKVIIDAGAMLCLQYRGFSKYLGVTVGDKVSCIASTEAFDSIHHSDGCEMRLPIRIHGSMWNELTLNGATQYSRYVTPYGKEYPGTARFDNSLGGTIIMCAANGNLGDGFFSSYRVEWIKDILSCVSQGSIPKLCNKSYALFAAKETKDKAMYFIANMSADITDTVRIKIPHAVKGSGKVVDMYGKEHEIICECDCVKLNGLKLGLYEAAVCIIDK